MDNRRLSTADVLASGILDAPSPKTPIPDDREQRDVMVEDLGADDLIGSVDSGVVLSCSEYYGIPYIWKEADRYRGILLQYRAVTEDRTFITAQEALDWFTGAAWRCAG